eukprot:1632601-Prymnesium_polylepis.1
MAHGTPNVAIVSNDSRLATTEHTALLCRNDQVDPTASKVAGAIAEHDAPTEAPTVDAADFSCVAPAVADTARVSTAVEESAARAAHILETASKTTSRSSHRKSRS